MPVAERYRQLFCQPASKADSAQRQAVDLLARLEGDLDARSALQPQPPGRTPEPPSGLYLWGNPGRGKTLLMDLFHGELQTTRKLRMHFHRFMKRVHNDLFRLSGTRNPLTQIAREIAAQTDVLCFDEFFVSDIADAMILGHLTEALFSHGVTLVATSNQHPDQLYPDGVQRGRFLPAIDSLKAHCQVFELDGDRDYRRCQRPREQICFSGPHASTEPRMQQRFHLLSNNHSAEALDICVEKRQIHCRGSGNGVGWFEFSALCEGPRSQNDYIFLARNYHTLLISNIPRLGGGPQQQRIARGTEDAVSNPTGSRIVFNDDRTRRFISLVDELYDHSVNLYCSMETSLDKLYLGGHLTFEFRRTRSRLLEMQSREYLQRPHHPD